MTMKQLTTAFVLIPIFAGYGIAELFDISFNTTQNMTTIYAEGSSTTTVEPSLSFDNVSVHCTEGKALNETVRRLKEDFSKHVMKVRAYIFNVNKLMNTFKHDKGWEELKNYIPSAEKKIRCYCDERLCEPSYQKCNTFCLINTTLRYCTYNHYCYDGSAKITSRNLKECDDPWTNELCHQFMRPNITNALFHYVTQHAVTAKESRFLVKIVRESIRSMDNLSNSNWQHCRDPTNTLHAPEATKLFEGDVKYYKQLAENFTKEFIDIETEIDRIEGKVQILAERTIKEMNDETKAYVCCMKHWNFHVEGVDCKDFTGFPKMFGQPTRLNQTDAVANTEAYDGAQSIGNRNQSLI